MTSIPKKNQTTHRKRLEPIKDRIFGPKNKPESGEGKYLLYVSGKFVSSRGWTIGYWDSVLEEWKTGGVFSITSETIPSRAIRAAFRLED